jgi:hypothetical protein
MEIKIINPDASCAFEMADPDLSLLRETIPGHGYEPGAIDILRRVLPRQGVFVDVGALYGYFALYAGWLQPELRVLAIEPQAAFFDVLTQNVSRSAIGVDCSNCAFSDSVSTLTMEGKALIPREGSGFRRLGRSERILQCAADFWYQGGFNRPFERAADGMGTRARRLPWMLSLARHRWSGFRRDVARREMTVPATTFDAWAAQKGVTATVAKIDVHGAEGQVLRGMARSLREDLQHVLLEVHDHDLLIDTTHHEVVNLLEAAGLNLYEIEEFRTSARPKLTPLRGDARDRLVDPDRWRWKDKALMRMILATKDPSVVKELLP